MLHSCHCLGIETWYGPRACIVANCIHAFSRARPRRYRLENIKILLAAQLILAAPFNAGSMGALAKKIGTGRLLGQAYARGYLRDQ